MKLSLMPESRRRCHSYLRVSGISCAEERERLIDSSLDSGKEPLVALHEILIERQKANRPSSNLSKKRAPMQSAPFLFFWERDKIDEARLPSDNRSPVCENFFTGIRGWLVNAVRIR